MNGFKTNDGEQSVGCRPAWGKTDVDGVPSHHLAHHSMDVAAVLEALLRHPVLSARAAAAAGSQIGRREVAWLAAFAFLHDIGKLSPRFQAKAWQDGISGGTRSHLDEGRVWTHALFDGAPLLDGAVGPLLAPLVETGEDCCVQWFEALLAHHGAPVDVRSQSGLPSDIRKAFPERAGLGYDWRAEDRLMGRALRSWFPDVAITSEMLRSPRLVHLFAGLLALADWIGSDESAFPHVAAFDPSYGERARIHATEALHAIGLLAPSWPTTAPSFEALTGHSEPRGIQRTIAEVPDDARLVVVEAETGSGKTEAALAHFARLRSEGLVDALYFAVPTRAAAGQLHRRIHEAISRV
ncbi:MAG: CRISPR-associated endonuclease Cas3'', partial [Shimia sp.]